MQPQKIQKISYNNLKFFKMEEIFIDRNLIEIWEYLIERDEPT